MNSIDGLYTEINAIIHEKEEQKRLAISVDQMVKELMASVNIDVHSASMDWYIETALKSAISTVLNQNGYRSVIKGDGLFINPDICLKKEYMARLINNVMLEENQKKQIEDMLMKKAESGIPGQLCFDPETGSIVEEITLEELVSMLKKDAGVA